MEEKILKITEDKQMKEIKFKIKLSFLEKRNTYLFCLPANLLNQNKLFDADKLFFYEKDNKIYLTCIEPDIKNFYQRKTQPITNGKYKRIPFPIQLRNKYIIEKNQTMTLVKQDDTTCLCEFEYPLILRGKFIKENNDSILKEISKVEDYLNELKNNFEKKEDI